MKYFLQILLFFLLITQRQYPQWTNQNLVPDHNDLWSTFFVDDSTGWIVGSGGFIKKTTNAGNEWIQQNSGSTLILKVVQFVDQNTGWICGEAGLILKTTDSGANWHSLTSGTIEHLSDIHFYDADTGYVAGFNGTLLKTTNGGANWTSLSSGTTNDLFSMDFVDAFTGYAAGEINDTSSVIKTTDGGATWIDKSSRFPATRGNCLAVEFIDATTGFIGGSSPFFYKTTDGGDTWGESESPLALGRKEIDNGEQLNIYPYAGINSVYFRDANNGWYLFWWGSDNYIYRTTDGGITWEREYRASDMYNNPLLSVVVSQNGTGLAVGSRGLICLKENTNSVWSRIFSGSIDDVYSIHFINKNIGWAAGTRWGNPYRATVFKTTNGGKVWINQIDELVFDMVCVYFINELIGWSVNSSVGSVWLTTDGGDNWTSSSVLPSENLKLLFNASLFFIDASTGWYTSQGWIRKSTDGGNTWINKSSTGGLSVFFIDQNNGWVAGDNGILKSTDGGESWVVKSSLTASYVRFYDSNIGMCVGGGSVLVSMDGGENWTTKSGPSLQTINFINQSIVLGYTSEGTLYKTTNLGNTWETLNTGLGFGETAFFINEYTGWVGGLDGTMFKYSNEPMIAITSPKGGEVWKSGWQRNITWTSENISNVNLYYSTNGGVDWLTIASNVDASSGNYNWTVPILNWFLNFNCKVKIENASNSSIYDESDNNFIIWHFCNIIQYANLGQRIIDFLETNIDISMNVTTADNISVNFYPYETPNGGTLPSGVVVLSDYYWQISSPAISFNNGKMIIPISTLRGVTDASKLVWLKRSNSGDPWENIGGTVVGENLESTVLFNSFSEFAIGSTDPANPLPVELSSFTAISKSDQILLEWVTKTETNNYGFEIERKLSGNWQKIGFVEGNGNSNSTKEYSFTDNKLIGGTKFQYRLKQIDNDGRYEYSAFVEVENIPTEYALYQNYPNPFNPTTKIRYQLPKESKVVIKIYNILGSEVLELLNKNKEPGIYEVEFNASNLSSGTYIYKISADNFVQTKKMILLK